MRETGSTGASDGGPHPFVLSRSFPLSSGLRRARLVRHDLVRPRRPGVSVAGEVALGHRPAVQFGQGGWRQMFPDVRRPRRGEAGKERLRERDSPTKGPFPLVFRRTSCPPSSSVFSISDSGNQKAQVPGGRCLSVTFTSSALLTSADS